MPILTMAQVPAFDLQVTFAAIDPEGVLITRTKTYEVRGEGADAAARWADAQANRDAFLADLALATGADIIGHRLTERYGTADSVTSTVNLYREMLITFHLASLEPKKAPHAVPAPSANFANGETLNLGHADVSNYVANLITTDGTIFISDGETVKDTNGIASSRVRQVRSGVSYT